MRRVSSAATFALLLAIGIAASAQTGGPQPLRHPATPTGVRAFLEEANAKLLEVWRAVARASWTYETYITPDTEIMVAEAGQAYVTASTNYAKEAFRFKGVAIDAVDRRQLDLLGNSLTRLEGGGGSVGWLRRR